MKTSLILSISLLFLYCPIIKDNSSFNNTNPYDLIGMWLLSPELMQNDIFDPDYPGIRFWLAYPSINFSADSSVSITANADTIIIARYRLKNDSLFLYYDNYKRLISKSKIFITKDSLTLFSLLNDDRTLIYHREKRIDNISGVFLFFNNTFKIKQK